MQSRCLEYVNSRYFLRSNAKIPLTGQFAYAIMQVVMSGLMQHTLGQVFIG